MTTEIEEIIIDDLPPVAAAELADVHILMRGGQAKRVTSQQLADLFMATISVTAPEALDTWLELVAQIEDNEDGLAALVTALAGKADATTTNINSLTVKATPVDADEFRLADSGDSFGFKKLTFASLKAWVLNFLPIKTVYKSTGQSITPGGLVTLAHGLSTQPKSVFLELLCISGDAGYIPGDVVSTAAGTPSGNKGVSVRYDATNIDIRYGTDANPFNCPNKSSGVGSSLTPANWNLVVTAIG